MTLDVRLLGQLRVDRPGDASGHRLTGLRAQAALAVLMLERDRGVPRDVLAEVIWPHGVPATWRTALRGVVKAVRDFLTNVLPECPSPVVAEDGRYVLRLPEGARLDVEVAAEALDAAWQALDVGELARARSRAAEAAASLRRPFLPDHDGDWAAGVRAHLGEQLLSALEVISQAAGALGDASGALAAADEAIARAPLRESAHRCRMAAYASGGNRSEALRAYHHLRGLLAEELGVDPAPETEAAYLDLLGASPASLPSPAGAAPARSRLGGPAPFVGRQAELARLSDAWECTVRGAGRLAVLTGEAGIGKSRLATELARRATEHGGLVLLAPCDRHAAVAYQPFVEMLDGRLRGVDRAELPPLGAAAWESLAAVFPSLAAGAPRPSPMDRAGLFDAVTSVIRWTTSDRPVLVVLDDLQWADDDSLLLLRHLLDHTADCRLMYVLIARQPRRLWQLLSDAIAGRPATTVDRIRLGPLAPAACRALVHGYGAAGDRTRCTRVLGDAGGHPGLLVAALRSVGTAGDGQDTGVPFGVHELVASVLDELTPAAAALVQAASIGPAPCELDALRRAAGVGEDGALDALDAALASGLMVEVGGGEGGRGGAPARYRIARELMRRAVQDQLSSERRRQLHARWADSIEAAHGGEVDRHVLDLAEHRLAAASGGDRHAVRWALVAARQARDRRAPADAATLARRALAHVPSADAELRANVMTELGLALAGAGDRDAEQVLLDAVVLARDGGRADLAAHAALGLADAARSRSRWRPEAVAVLQDTLAARRNGRAALGDEALTGRLLARLIQLDGGQPSRADDLAVATAQLRSRLRTLEGPRHLLDRASLAEDLAILAGAAGDRTAGLVATHHQAMVAAVTGDERAKREALDALATADSDARAATEALLAEHLVATAASQGRFDEAEAAAKAAGRRGTSASDLVGPPAPGSMVGRQLLIARWLQARADRATDPPRGSIDGDGEDVVAALLAGNRGHARFAARVLVNRAGALPDDDAWLHTVALLAVVAVDLDDRPLAEATSALLAPYAELTCGVGYRSFAGPASLHLGRLAAVTGELAEAERRLTAALGRLTAVGARPWSVVAQRTLATVLAARGRASDRTAVHALQAEATATATVSSSALPAS